jgi:6-phosphogluconolactonase (cycloisomerase 2 family)
MGRWVASVDVNPRSKGFKEVRYIDLSNGYGALAYPNADEIPPEELMTSFVHAHWVAADPKRRTVLVTGEHTGNLGVVETKAQKGFGLAQVVPISIGIPGCEPPVDETGAPVTPEPHVHGVQIDPRSGEAYVSDEGEDCFYESVTILKP